jgi:hypothetical protein
MTERQPESPTTLSLPRISQEHQKQGLFSSQEKLWLIKDIIDEKVERGRLWYKVDWEDDIQTGESFAPTWVRSGMLPSISNHEASNFVDI